MILRALSTLWMGKCEGKQRRKRKIIILLCIRFPLEMHIVHKKVGEPNFLSVEGGLAVTGFFFEVQLLRIFF